MLFNFKLATEASEAQSLDGRASTTTHRERDDNYRYVALELTPRWRIASCVEGRQWILQYRRTKDRWTGRKYFPRAAYVPGTVKQMLGDDVFQVAKAWAEKHPNT